MLNILNSRSSDEALMLKYQRGDSSAFDTLYARHKDKLFAFLYRSHVDLSAIEEIAQETWLAVIRSSQNYRETAKFRTYLYAIAHRKLVDFWRRNRHGMIEDSIDDQGRDLVDQQADPMQPASDAVDLSMDLLLALESLSKEQQQAFLLREEGFTRSEIAVMTESNEETIKSRIRYATNHLKRMLKVTYAEA